jgi:hypothetical protein
LYHYESAKSGGNEKQLKTLPCIDKLFNLSVSKVYKATKLQYDIIIFMSGKIPGERDL